MACLAVCWTGQARAQQQAAIHPDPVHNVSYLTAPSAFQLPAGRGTYQTSYLLIHTTSIGLSRHLSVGGGVELLSPLLAEKGPFAPFILLHAKAGRQLARRFHVGASAAIWRSISEVSSARQLLLMQALGTYGQANRHATVGIGWGWAALTEAASGRLQFEPRPIISLSGISHLSGRWALLTENRMLPTNDGYLIVYGYGVRLSGKRLALDLALLNSKDLSALFIAGVPFVKLAVRL